MAPIDHATMAPAQSAQDDGVATDASAGLGDQPPPRPSPEKLRMAHMNCNNIHDRCLLENKKPASMGRKLS